MITSQIKSRIEYSIPTRNSLMLLLYSNLSLMMGFQYYLMIFHMQLTFCLATLYLEALSISNVMQTPSR